MSKQKENSEDEEVKGVIAYFTPEEHRRLRELAKENGRAMRSQLRFMTVEKLNERKEATL